MIRKKGDDWYIAAMTDWTPRTLDLDCSFLPPGTWNATIYKDGINADRYASDYEIFKTQLTQDDQLSIEMAAGGGWVAKMSP
jgi:alpha-glucosidase